MPRVALKTMVLVAALGLCLTACNRNERRTQAAFAEYQAASAAGDLRGTRDALLKLVAVDEDVGDYWMQLGQVQLQLGAYQDAYYALSRALELNRSSPDLLRVLAQLSVRSDRLDLAEDYAKQLDLVAPGDPAVLLTRAVVALQQDNLDEASKQADLMLKANPANSDARLIQSQVLQRSGKSDEAIALLERQVAITPRDAPTNRALAGLYEEKNEPAKVARYRRTIWELAPQESANGIVAVDAALRAGDIPWARQASMKLLADNAPPLRVRALLDVWNDYWPGPDRIALARQLAQDASPEQKVEYAAFMVRAGAPAEAAAILSPLVGSAPGETNASAAGIYAEALAGSGKLADARRWIDGVLAIDQENVDALRAAILLDLKQGRPALAVTKAQKLVTLSSESADDRSLLVQAYLANREPRDAERALWQSFHDLPADRHAYGALRQYLAKSGDSASVQRIDQEFADQRRKKYLKDLI